MLDTPAGRFGQVHARETRCFAGLATLCPGTDRRQGPGHHYISFLVLPFRDPVVPDQTEPESFSSIHPPVHPSTTTTAVTTTTTATLPASHGLHATGEGEGQKGGSGPRSGRTVFPLSEGQRHPVDRQGRSTSGRQASTQPQRRATVSRIVYFDMILHSS